MMGSWVMSMAKWHFKRYSNGSGSRESD